MTVRLYINNKEVALKPGQSITREFESNLLNREPIVTDFTYTVQIALTDDTIRAMGYVHVQEIVGLQESYAGKLVADEVWMKKVTIYLLKVDDEDMVAEVTIVGDYGSYGSVVGDKKLSDLVLGGVRTIGAWNPTTQQVSIPVPGIGSRDIHYTGCTSGTYMNQLANGTATDDYVFPMCADTVNPGINQSGTYGKSVINAYFADDDTGENFYVDPIVAQIATVFRAALIDETVEPIQDRYYWVPMFRLAYVLRRCFEEFGFSITPGSIIEDPKFLRIILYNTYAINKVLVHEAILGGDNYDCIIQHDARTIDPKNHMPDMTITEFIHEVGKAYNLQFDIDHTKATVDIRMLLTFDFAAPSVDITPISSKFSVINNTQTEAKWKRGFVLKHTFDPADMTAMDEEVMDQVQTLGWNSAHTSVFQMEGSGINTIGHRAYVRSENKIFRRGDDGWHFVCNNMGKYRTVIIDDSKLQEITTKVSTVTMYMHGDMYLHRGNVSLQFAQPDPASIFHNVLVPTSNYGICGNQLLAMEDWATINETAGPISNSLGGCYATNLEKISIYPRVLNWLGRMAAKKTSYGDKYPYASGTKYDVNGTLFSASQYQHYWSVYGESTAMYWEWWQRWTTLLNSGVPVDVKAVIPDINFYNKLRWNNIMVKRNGLKYILIKSTEQMPFPSEATLQLFLLKK